jgi:crotonobetainyl-CoA:carnitine CoA-transferase CaiB-like acyl-CoA transferase
VLDLSSKSFAGCYCSAMLAEFGAEVLRVEPPEGDFIRSCTPYGILHQGEGLNYLTEGETSSTSRWTWKGRRPGRSSSVW